MSTTLTATAENKLGGRLPLLAPADLDPEQKKLYDAVEADMVRWATASGFRAETTDGRLIGPFNAMLYSPPLGQGHFAMLQAETQHTTLSPTVRQVVILTVGQVWQAAYELYAHTAVARQAGLAEATIQALVAGQPPKDLSANEQVAYDFTRQLVTKHQVGADLLRQAVAAFGQPGVVNLIYLIGNYLTTSAILNVFDVPVPAAR